MSVLLHLHHYGIKLNAPVHFCVGLSLSEVGNNRTSSNKVVCCHFSTDGKLLASAGHEKKVKCLTLDIPDSFPCS